MWPLNCDHGVSCNLARFCSELRSWSSSPSMHYRHSSGSKSPPFRPKAFSLLPKIQQAAGTVFLASGFVNISHRGGNKLQRFCNLLCWVRITACSVGFVLSPRLPCGRCLDYPTARSCLVFEVSRKLPGWRLDAAYERLFNQTNHTGPQPKCSLVVQCNGAKMHYAAYATQCMECPYAIQCDIAPGVFGGGSVWSQALQRCCLFVQSLVCWKGIPVLFLCSQSWFCGHRDPGRRNFWFSKDKKRLKTLLESGQFWNLVPGFLWGLSQKQGFWLAIAFIPDRCVSGLHFIHIHDVCSSSDFLSQCLESVS